MYVCVCVCVCVYVCVRVSVCVCVCVRARFTLCQPLSQLVDSKVCGCWLCVGVGA